MKLVLNASPLIFLAKIDMIDLLPEIAERCIIPFGVINEIKQHQDEVSWRFEQNTGKFNIKSCIIPPLISAWDLGKGESEVIAYAYKHKDYVVALDDKAARSCAMVLHIEVIGTLGIILMAKRKNLIDNAEPYLKKLLDSGFRISSELYEHALKLSRQ
jgi:predicted nucleic acid-binding protein